MSRLDDVPPTPKIKGFDLEKGVKTKYNDVEVDNPPTTSSKWGRRAEK